MNIKSIKVTSPLEYAMDRLEKEITVKNPVKNVTAYREYKELLDKLAVYERQGKVKLNCDNPDQPLESHHISIYLIEDTWTETDKENLLDILHKVNGVMFSGDSEGTVNLFCLYEGIYTEKQ